MMEFLSEIVFWHWLIFGAALLLIEIFAPSAVFLWPGLAALAVGVIEWVFPGLGWLGGLLIWGILTLVGAIGWQFYKSRKTAPEPSNMNRRGQQYVGRHYTLQKDIINGAGELNVDDTRWRAISTADLSAGTKVRVIAVEGTSLRVEPYLD